MSELQGKRALVTGGGRRVGRAITLALARAGTDIVVHYNQSSKESDAVAAEVLDTGRQVDTIKGDLSDPAAIEQMLSELDRHEIAIDILVNSAAVYYPTPLSEVTPEIWDKIIAVNLRAPFLMAQGLGLRMKKRGQGCIINIADCNLQRPYRDFTPYFAAKAGVAMITETLALELSPEVRVNAISPGTVLPPDDADVNFKTQSINRSPLKIAGTPEDIADMAVYLAAKGRFITGSNIRVDGGATIR